MKITISVHQRYHAFRLAEELDKRGLLRTLHTVYPKRIRLGGYKVPDSIRPERIHSYPILGILRYAVSRMVHLRLPDELLVRLFDLRVAHSLPPPASEGEIFHGWNASCLWSLRRAKRLGYRTVVERSCPHADSQEQLIQEEKARLLGRWAADRPRGRVEQMVERYEIREYEEADYIITPSSYARRSFLERGFAPEKVLAIPLSLEKQTEAALGKKRRDQGFKVLFVGGDFYRKGLYYLLEAWRMLGLPDAELIVKGRVPKEFSRLRSIQNVRFLDHYVSEEELRKLYAEAHLFVLPSIDEGFGMVVAEAMTAGLPVIVTENVGAADNIRDGVEGFVVPIRDTEALSKKIRFFYEHSEALETMGAAALKKSAFFSPSAYVNRMVKAYREMQQV